MSDESKQLSELIRAQYDALDGLGVVGISPADLARRAYAVIDAESISPVLVHLAAELELRQLARQICAERHRNQEREAEETIHQGSLFPVLQQRYPTDRGEEGEYVLRAHLTYAERYRNIDRLRREARAKNAHADALQAETDALVRSGDIYPTDTVQ